MMYRNDIYKAKTLPKLNDITTLELMRVKLTTVSGRRICVYIVYHPPRGTKLSGTENEFYDDLDILFTDASISVVPVIILGDFNVHFNNVLKSSRLRNLLLDFQLTQHVSDSTHENGNTIDLVIICLYENLLKSVVVRDYALSDHHTVECIVNMNKDKQNIHFILKRSLHNIDMNAFSSDLDVLNTTIISDDTTNTDKWVRMFNELLSSLMDKHAPLKRIRIRTQPHPWYDNDIRDARLKRRKCEKNGK